MKEDIYFYIANIVTWFIIFNFKLYKYRIVRSLISPIAVLKTSFQEKDEIDILKIIGFSTFLIHSIYLVFILLNN